MDILERVSADVCTDVRLLASFRGYGASGEVGRQLRGRVFDRCGDVHHARINDNRPAYALTEADGEQPERILYPHVEHADLVFSAIMEADAVLYGSDAERDERYHHALLDAADPAFGRHDYVGFDERIGNEGIVDYPYFVGHVRVLLDPRVVGVHIDLDRAFSDKRDNERYYRKYQKEYEEHRRRGRAQSLSEYEGKHQKKYVEYEPSGYPSFLFHIIIPFGDLLFPDSGRRRPDMYG